jgi:hypothetical protein
MFYCLECNESCEYEYCSVCEQNPMFESQPHAGFTSDAEIQQEIDAENFWCEYDSR